MAASPIAVICVLILSMTFQGLFFGAEIAASSFPTPIDGGPGCETVTGLTGDTKEFATLANCARAFVSFIGNVVLTLVGVVVFVFNLLTFNIPGAPWYVRVPVGTMFGGALVWAVATLTRGN